MKPLFVICPGLMKSGTTSLFLHFYNSYLLHFGHGKEHYYLNNIYQNNYDYENKFRNNFLTEDFFTFKENHKFNTFKSYYQERTLENYKNYFLEIWEYYVSHKQMFYGVADFSQSYAALSLDNIKHFRDYITEYFDVKIIRLVRDPIRRLYSYCNMVAGKEKAKEYFYEILTDKDKYYFYSKINSTFIANWNSEVWGDENTTVSVYERIFNKNTNYELERLSEFLNIPYLPIKKEVNILEGIYKDQLDQEDIEFAKEKLRQEYAFFHNTQKVLPSSWEYADQWNIDSLDFRNIQNNYNINPIDHY